MLVLVSPGCRDDGVGVPSAANAQAVQPPVLDQEASGRTVVRSPVDTIHLLRSLRERGEYAEMALLIVEDRRDTAIAIAEAADKVLAANARLRAAVDEEYGVPSCASWDLSGMENNLSIFSSRLKLISQRFTGDHAVVTLQQGDHVPLVRARFELGAHGWEYRPPAAPLSMAGELEKLAGAVDCVAHSIKCGASFEEYMASFFEQVLPQMNRVVTVKDEPPSTVASGNPVD
jgi:hypothetical protein